MLFRNLFNGMPRTRIAKLLIFSCLFSICDCWFVQITSTFVDMSGLSDIPKFCAIMVINLLAFSTAEYFLDLSSCFGDVEVENNLNRYYLTKMYYIKPEVLKKNNTGYLSGLVQKVVSRQCEALDHVVANLPMNMVFMIFYTAILMRESFGLGICIPILYAITTVVRIWWNNHIVDKPWSVYSDSDGEKHRIFLDLLSNINTIQKMQALKFADKTVEDISKHNFNLAVKAHHADEPGFLLAKYGMFSFVLIAAGIVYATGNEQILNDPELMAVLAMVAVKIPHNARGMYKAILCTGRFNVTLNNLLRVVNDSNNRVEVSTEDFESAEIVYSKYSYTDVTNNLITIDIPYFCVNKGDIVCVHGESGQGKTTLLHILSKEIETGDVKLNGKFVKERLDCAFIAQDTEMLDMTLRDNLTLGKSIPDHSLVYYLESVGLGEWFHSQKDGLETILGERGVFVSTGQRQRLNLIRGLLMADKEVYLLDEPTSNVDEETEKKIIELLRVVLQGKTAVIVTHRPAIMEICNRSYLFENGVLREE